MQKPKNNFKNSPIKTVTTNTPPEYTSGAAQPSSGTGQTESSETRAWQSAKAATEPLTSEIEGLSVAHS